MVARTMRITPVFLLLFVFHANTEVDSVGAAADAQPAPRIKHVLSQKATALNDGAAAAAKKREDEEQEEAPKMLLSHYAAANHLRVKTTVVERIVGGELASPGDYPWFISSTGNYFCGASLIYPDVALTAAHCILAFAPRSIVLIGTTRRGEYDSSITSSNSTNSNRTNQSSRTITAVLPHPLYNEQTIEYDYMLLQLDRPIDAAVDGGATPIAVNFDDAIPADDEELLVMGFGQTSYNGQVSAELLQVPLQAVNAETCALQYARLLPDLNEDILLCASGLEFGQGSCQGDSGGPLVTTRTNTTTGQEELLQVGIVSFGAFCALQRFPGVYARTSGVSDWIQQGICQLSQDPPSALVENGGTCTSHSPPEPDTDLNNAETSANAGGGATIKVVVSYGFFADRTMWTISQDVNILYTGPQYDAAPFERWETYFRNVTAGSYTFSILFGSAPALSQFLENDPEQLGSFEIWHVLDDDDDANNLPTGGSDNTMNQQRNNENQVLLARGDQDTSSEGLGQVQSVSFYVPGIGEQYPSGNNITDANDKNSTGNTQHNPCVCEGDAVDCIKAICHALRNDEEQEQCAQLGCVWIGNDDDVSSASGGSTDAAPFNFPLFLRIALGVTLIAVVSTLLVYHVACRRKRDDDEANGNAADGDGDNDAIDNANDNMTVASLEEADVDDEIAQIEREMPEPPA
jgi:trypsin